MRNVSLLLAELIYVGVNMTHHKNVTGALITGGAGFLGSHIAERYLNLGLPVVVVDNLCTGMRANIEYLKKTKHGAGLTFVETDVIEPWAPWAHDLPKDVKNKISHVFHFASPASPPLYQEMAFETMWVNTKGLEHALHFADELKARVIFASTSEIYGDPLISPQPETFWGNVNSFGIRSCYDEAKRFGESLIFTHNWKKKTNHGLVRIFNTYGPRMNPSDGRVIINFLVHAIRKEPLTMYGDGKQTRSFCFVSDLVEGIHRYAESSLVEPVNIGNDNEFSLLELVDVIRKLFAPAQLEVKYLPLPKDDPKQRRPDTRKAKEVLAGWQPKVQLREGLIQMREWLEHEGLKS
jgi:nucleoside-diphosphate-sugar epimerase